MVLTVAYNSQNYWFLDFVHRPIFYKLENITFQELDLFPSSGEVGRHLLCWVPFRHVIEQHQVA
jgi:hypothetical protein